MAVTHNGVTYRVADAHAHIYPGKIAEKATANVGRFYDIEMEEVGLPHILSEEGKAAGIDRYLVCSVATKVEQVESINRFIAEKCAKYPAFIGLGAWHQDVADIEGELDRIQALGLRGIKLHPDFQCFNIDDDRMLPVYEACMRRGMVVLFHTGDDRTDFSSPRRLANVLESCRSSSVLPRTSAATASGPMRAPCCTARTSTSIRAARIFAVSAEDARRSIAHFGIDKTLFGTDFPMWSPKEELERLFCCSATEKRKTAGSCTTTLQSSFRCKAERQDCSLIFWKKNPEFLERSCKMCRAAFYVHFKSSCRGNCAKKIRIIRQYDDIQRIPRKIIDGKLRLCYT